MRATPIFFASFILFTAVSITIPISLFPGNIIPALSGIPTSEYTIYLQALTNGLTYGFTIWIIFFLVDKKLEQSTSIESKRLKR